MALTRLKTILGYDPTWKRYHSGEYTSLEDIADPETWEDDTKTTWRDWVSESRGNQILVGVSLVIGVGLLVYFSQLFIRLSTGVLSNRLFQAVVGALGLVTVTYVYATKAQRKRFQTLDWLVLPKDGGGVTRFLGYYREGDATDAPLFVPVKGFRWNGHKAEPYRIYEVSSELARRYKNTNRDPEDVAVIRLEPDMARVSQTETGTVICQQTTELKLDEFGNESCLKAPVSEKQADTDAVQDLKRTLDDVRKEISYWKAEASKFERQRNEAQQDAKQRRESIIDEFLEKAQAGAKAFQTRPQRRGRSQTDAEDLPPAAQQDMQQMDKQLSYDDN
ncbi:hypothetical protein [Natrinema pallidum]|uniref:Uncharacterized protein n=1 Tax=Natrinema pallidum TaxID=69527 RepID=A0A4P9TJR2_9EURY|nr:hypothetical protein [Natrinema pallidum]QCW05241.1 hypothetical protein FGF80_18505 [Natrinema pallidum]